MALKTFTSGVNTSFSSQLNAMYAEGLTQSLFSLCRQLEAGTVTFSAGYTDAWGDAYIDASGRLDSVSVTNTSAIFSSNKYIPGYLSGDPYVIINATALTTTDFAINNCKCYLVSAGVWMLFCHTGTTAVKRAQIYKTLFYGTNGTDARGTTTYITGITALKTNTAADVGKRAYFAKISFSSDTATATYTGTFANTTTNTACSTWSYCYGQVLSGSGAYAQWNVNGSAQNYADNSTTVDETGTDTSADNTNNPTNCSIVLGSSSGGTRSADGRAIVLCVGAVTWVETEFSSPGGVSYSNIDFFTTHSVPLLTSDAGTYANIIEMTIPTGTFPAGITKAILAAKVAPGTWESGADIQYKLSDIYSGGNISDTSENSTANTSYESAKSFGVAGGLCSSIAIDMKDGGSNGYGKVTFLYRDGTSFETAEQTVTSSSYVTKTFTNTSPSKALQTITIYYKTTGSNVFAKNATATVTSAGSTETSWLPCGNTPVVSSFAAMTAEPLKIVIKLIPKSSSPTAGYPSISAVAVRATP
jgi:hypothetical protein